MNASHFLCPPAVVFSLLLACPALQGQVPGTRETFTFLSNADSWGVFDYSELTSYHPDWDSAGDGENPDIYWTFTGDSSLDFFADEAASGGAFTGDYTAGGVSAIGCDYYVEEAAAVGEGQFFFLSGITDRYYYQLGIVPEEDGWNSAFASLYGDDWYVITDGDFIPVVLTPEILSSVTEVGFTLFPLDASADGQQAAIDNFTLYADITPPALSVRAASGSLQITFERKAGVTYTIAASSSLGGWLPVPGQEGISGTGPYIFTQPLKPGKHFFRVELDDRITPLPEL